MAREWLCQKCKKDRFGDEGCEVITVSNLIRLNECSQCGDKDPYAELCVVPNKEVFLDITMIPVDWSKVKMLVPADQVTVLNMEDVQPCEIQRYVKFTFPETSETVSVEENNDEIPKE